MDAHVNVKRRDPRILALLCVLLGGMGQGVVAPKLPELLSGTGHLALAAGFSAAVMYFGIFISTYRYGELADRGKVHWLMSLGLISYAASLLALGQIHSELLLFGVRLFEGLSISAVFVGADYILGRFSPAETRGQWLSYYGAALSVGLLSGPALGLATGNLRLSLSLVAALSCACGILSARIRVRPAAPVAGAKPPLEPGALASGAGYGFMEAGLVAVFPVLAVTEFHVVPEYCLVVCILAAAVSSLVWGLASDRYSPKRVMRVLLLGLAVLPLTLLLFSGAFAAFCACVIFGVLAGGLYPTGFSWLLEGLPEAHYGYASGAFARAYGMGSLVGPLLIGTGAHFFGARGFLLCMAAAGAVSLWIAFSQKGGWTQLPK